MNPNLYDHASTSKRGDKNGFHAYIPLHNCSISHLPNRAGTSEKKKKKKKKGVAVEESGAAPAEAEEPAAPDTNGKKKKKKKEAGKCPQDVISESGICPKLM